MVQGGLTCTESHEFGHNQISQECSFDAKDGTSSMSCLPNVEEDLDGIKLETQEHGFP